MALRPLVKLLLLAVLALCGCDWDYQGGGRIDSDSDKPAGGGGGDEGDCEVHAGDELDSVEIEWISDNFYEAGVGSEVQVRGGYMLHSREQGHIHALSCDTACQTVPAQIERGTGEFSASYLIEQTDSERERGCLLVLMYGPDSEKLLSCRFRLE